ncbi:MAG: HAMP domain-containing sensor histidine kinase [Hespellia sp.]|nr:HAMP domain-containing sensor histidine kinase [Hespellia sp.]
MFLLWILCGILSVTVIILCIRIYLLHQSMDEVTREFKEHLSRETNHLIQVSSQDRYVRKLANELNIQLAKLRKERQRYQQGDRELKEAVTNISHDLRTPLTAVCGYMDLLKKEETSEAVSRYLSQIQSRTEVMKELLEELFRYSIVSSTPELKMETVDLRKLLEECLLSFYGVMQQKGIIPDIQIPEQQVTRELDASAVSRIFNNVISNAIKYSDGDFAVRMDEKGVITFTNAASELTPVIVGRLFDRFYTVETGRKSTGLGLSIAKFLMEQQGGVIEAELQNEKLCIRLEFGEKNEEKSGLQEKSLTKNSILRYYASYME